MCRKSNYLTSFALVFCITVGVMQADLTHHWRLDGDLSDVAGLLDFSSSGGPVFTAGHHGGAMEFDGSDDYVFTELAVVMPSQTVCAWIRTSSDGSVLGWSAAHPTDGTQDRNFYVNADGTITFRIWTGATTTVTSQTLVNDDAWHHLAAGYTEGGELWLYVDGEFQGSTPSSGIWNSYSTSFLTVGIESHIGTYFTGAVDDVRVYDEALTEGQVLSAMTAGAFPFAFGPSPSDGMMIEAMWVNLGWRAGDFAVSHDVYIGENFDDVNDGSADTFAGNTDQVLQIVGFFGFPLPDGLVPGTTYYWRIDEVNDTEPNSPWKGDVWSFWIPPKKAYEPSVPDGIEFVITDVELSWTAGFGAMLHTVYFGDDLDTVTNATGGTAQTETTYNPGALETDKTYYWRVDEFEAPLTHKGDIWSFATVPNIPVGDPDLVGRWTFDEGQGATAVDWSGHGNHGTLINGTQWALDGYNSAALQFDGTDDYVEVPDSPSLDITDAITIATWVFRKVDNGAWERIVAKSDSSLYDYWLQITSADSIGGGFVDIGGTAQNILDLTPGISVPVNQWTHLAFVYDGTYARGYVDGQLDKSEDIGSLTIRTSTRPLWVGRLQNAYSFDGLFDDVHIYDKALSEDEIGVLMLGDTKLAGSPVPARHATVDIRDIDSLSWSKGDMAVSHDVYFGQDSGDIALADNTSPQFQGNQAGTSLSLTSLVEFGGGDYYWRVDEVAADGMVTAGTVWKFTVPGYLIVEDFESYNDLAEDDPASNRIYLTWIDGFGTTTNGAVAGNLDVPLMEAGRDSAQAMPVSYDNAGKTSEVTKTLTSGKDWAEQGVTKLVVWFSGDSANAAERMFVALGNAVVYHPDDAATQDGGWNDWVIDLQEFASQGANLSNVGSITLGFGTRNAPAATGGIGTVEFDDIGLIR